MELFSNFSKGIFIYKRKKINKKSSKTKKKKKYKIKKMITKYINK